MENAMISEEDCLYPCNFAKSRKNRPKEHLFCRIWGQKNTFQFRFYIIL